MFKFVDKRNELFEIINEAKKKRTFYRKVTKMYHRNLFCIYKLTQINWKTRWGENGIIITYGSITRSYSNAKIIKIKTIMSTALVSLRYSMCIVVCPDSYESFFFRSLEWIKKQKLISWFVWKDKNKKKIVARITFIE